MLLSTTSRRALELVGLSLVSVFFILKIVINGVLGSGIGPVKNDTGSISDIFETEVSGPDSVATILTAVDTMVYSFYR